VTNDSLLRLHLPGILLAMSLLIAVLFFVVLPPQRVARTLYFPGTTETTLSGERRLLPRVDDARRAMELLVEDMLLGPAAIQHSRALPRETRINSFILSDRTLYVDLSQNAMLQSAEVRVDVQIGLDAIRESLLYNFRRLDDVVITIDGNVPYAPAYRPLGR
jgi:hypothetical protein